MQIPPSQSWIRKGKWTKRDIFWLAKQLESWTVVLLVMFTIAAHWTVTFVDFRGWWTPLLFTASIASAKYFFQHVSRQNTLTQARRNISRHYDLVTDYMTCKTPCFYWCLRISLGTFYSNYNDFWTYALAGIVSEYVNI